MVLLYSKAMTESVRMIIMEGETHIIALEWKLGMWVNANKEQPASPEHDSNPVR